MNFFNANGVYKIIGLPASALIRDLSKSLDDEFPPSYSNS